MKVISCGNGHFYDGEKFAACPYCNGVGEPVTTGVVSSGTIPVQPMRQTVPVDPRDVPNAAAGDDGEEVTVSYEKDADREITQSYWNLPENKQEPTAAESGGIEISLVEETRFEPVVGWLVCVDGVERGRDYRLLAGRNYIGRSVDMDVSIPDDKQLSRDRHCSVVYDPRSFRFVLLPGDSSLTMVNGAAQNAPCDIDDGDIISCGSTKLCLIRFCKEGRDWE